ncbi:MAG: hypothetical protein L0177_03245 [Chloroflexi bacterium]|nr:hypothetical protein [Chloroflexota bacterium]
MRSKLRFGLLAISVGAVAAALALVTLWAAGALGSDSEVHAQTAQTSSMQQRLDQIIKILQADPGPEAVGAAIDDGLEILYGGLRPLPSLPANDAEGQTVLQQTREAHRAISDSEMRFAQALEQFALEGRSQEMKGRALDLKLFIEQMNEVAQAVGEVTQQCGNGQSLSVAPCDQLRPLLDEATGHEQPIGLLTSDDERVSGNAQVGVTAIRPSYSFKLRSPFVPRWFGQWEEDVLLTEPLASGECAVVFKETKGLMVRLHFERVTVVRDPWVATFGVPRGTRIPIWSLEWVPSEYVKEWNICNSNGSINKTVTQRVKQDIPLNFFWRYYPKTR